MVVITLSFIVGVTAWTQDSYASRGINSVTNIQLDALSWKSFAVACERGDTLSGSFRLTRDGDLFIGDQTKYDNWLLGGVNFRIFSEEDFQSWNQGLNVTADFERTNIERLDWSFKIPTTGIWYIVYSNDSIFMKQIESNITHKGEINLGRLEISILLGIVAALGIGLIFKRKR